MDISSSFSQGRGLEFEPTIEQQKRAVDYTAQAASPLVSGEVKLTIGENSLTVISLFDAAEIAYSEISELIPGEHIVTVKADSGDYVFSRLGNWIHPFLVALSGAYSKAVLRSLFIKSDPVVTARCKYRFTENGESFSGFAPVHVYDNNVTTLPPNLSARRLPLCFVTGMEKGDYEFTLRIGAEESYTYAGMGYDTAVFGSAVEQQIRGLREVTLVSVKDVDPTLSTAQASQISKLMPLGAAAPIGQLAGIAPSFITALETKISATRAAESYKVFKELSDTTLIWIGFRKNESSIDAGEMATGDTEEAAEPYTPWLIVPSPSGGAAAVEFAEDNSATFIYRTGGDFPVFAQRLNRALEAISFKREVIRMSDEDLRKPENVDYYMAAKRTSALQFVRESFIGRIIHSSEESWKRKLTELWG